MKPPQGKGSFSSQGSVFHKGLACRGGQFGQNGQKLHENYKINIFKAEQWEWHGGRMPNPASY